MTYNVQNLYESFSGMSDIVMSVAVGLNMTWPNVTVPGFDMHGEHVRKVTGSPALWSSPIVYGSNQAEWESYAQENAPFPIYPLIFTIANMRVVDETGPGPFAPAWQFSPQKTVRNVTNLESPVNFNILSDKATAETASVVTDLKFGALTAVLEFELMSHYFTNATSWRPMASIVEPIFQSMDKKTTVGFIQGMVDWTYYLGDVLSSDAQNPAPVYVVIRNSCNQTYAWTVAGPSAVYQGDEDLHDPAWEQYKQSIPLSPSTMGLCNYWMDIYPTQEFR